MISGFTQTLQRPNGVQTVWDALCVAARNARVVFYPWDFDWSALAEFILRFQPTDRPTRVYVYGYSWGGGWGFPQLALELQKRSITIEHAVLCDAVYRPRSRLLVWEALIPRSRIVVPANVREVSWFRQRTGLPMGHDVVAADPRHTKVNTGVLVPGCTHHYMDDQPCWQNKCLDIAAAARPAEPYRTRQRFDAAHGE